MIRVAICDDDIRELNKMQKFLDRYCRERSREIAHTLFRSPVELLTEIEGGGTVRRPVFGYHHARSKRDRGCRRD